MLFSRTPKTSSDQVHSSKVLGALSGVSTGVMIADNNLNIVYMNDAVRSFLQKVEHDIKKDLPHFDVATLVGKNIDIFHKNPAHQREMLAKLSSPYSTSIRVGGMVFNLRAYPLFNEQKERNGYVVEWTDSSIMDNHSKVVAIKKSQAVIEFNLDGTIITANENFLKTLGYELAEIRGKHHSMFVEPSYRDTAEYRKFWDDLRAGVYQSAQYKRIGKGGKEIWIEASYNPVLDLNGRVFKVVKFATNITKNIDQLKSIKSEMGRYLSRIDDAVGIVNQQTAAASSGASETTSNVQTVAAGAEELHASVVEISQTMSKTATAADEAFQKVVETDVETKKLLEAAQAMSGIVSLIQKIAEQVNLLSLNATIEAARAGEAGKGFAVVASEVKGLATQVAEATHKIGAEINNIQDVVSVVAKGLQSIMSSIDNARGYVAGVAGAVEEQSAVARDMSSNMQSASQAMSEVSSNLGYIVNALEDVKVSVDQTKTAATNIVD